MADKKTGALATAKAVRTALDDKKAENIVLLDVRSISQITDFVVVATGTSGPHLKALSNEVQRALKHNMELHCYRKSGNTEGGWIVLDYVDVIIHVFSTEARAYYSIEELWAEAPKIPLR